MTFNYSHRLRKKSVHPVCPRGVMSRGALIPTSVAIVEEMRLAENNMHRGIPIKSKTMSVSKIREKIAKSKMRKGIIKETRKVVSPSAFMSSSKINSKTMLVLTDAFLEGLGKTKPRNAFDVATRLRMRVPSLTESLIQSYSNWVYSFMQEKEGLQELIELRAKIQKEL